METDNKIEINHLWISRTNVLHIEWHKVMERWNLMMFICGPFFCILIPVKRTGKKCMISFLS